MSTKVQQLILRFCFYLYGCGFCRAKKSLREKLNGKNYSQNIFVR